MHDAHAAGQGLLLPALSCQQLSTNKNRSWHS